MRSLRERYKDLEVKRIKVYILCLTVKAIGSPPPSVEIACGPKGRVLSGRKKR